MPAPTLRDLDIDYPQSESIKHYIESGYFGGQIKVTLDTPITLELIKEVEKTYVNPQPCNQWEAFSIYNHTKRFEEFKTLCLHRLS
jgi:hypothetical protein